MTAAAQAAAPTERYRRERPPVSRECSDELARITDDIDDPIVKLRYLQSALNDDVEKSAALVHLVPIAPARRAWYRLKGLQALDAVADADDAVADRTLAARKTARRIVVSATAAGLLFVPVLVAVVAWQINSWTRSTPDSVASVGSSTVANATNIAPPTSTVMPTIAPAAAQDSVHQLPVAETLENEDLGIVPAMLWLADRGPGWELYSNGLRIETTYAVRASRATIGRSRSRRAAAERYSRPVGILFHTSESDLWPLEADFDAAAAPKRSAGLLRIVQTQQAYNYMIDRFGRVYRIVDDDKPRQSRRPCACGRAATRCTSI